MLSKSGNHKWRRHLAKLLCFMISNSQNAHSHSHKYNVRGMLVYNTGFAFCVSKMCPCKLMQNLKVSKTRWLLKLSSSSPCQYKIAPQYTITCGLSGFFLPPFVLLQIYVKCLISSKNACETQHWKTSEATLDFLTALKRAQLVSPSCPIPPLSQIQQEDSCFTCQVFCLWALKTTHTEVSE